jgi:hypothetical protein
LDGHGASRSSFKIFATGNLGITGVRAHASELRGSRHRDRQFIFIFVFVFVFAHDTTPRFRPVGYPPTKRGLTPQVDRLILPPVDCSLQAINFLAGLAGCQSGGAITLFIHVCLLSF